MNTQEFERSPVSPKRLEPARHFAASYAGEHVAGTEFVIGALFVSWGVATLDLLIGLVVGNLLAVLTWRYICAPVATDTRLTLYAYLEKIAGKGIVKLYSVVNGILFCVLAGAMITVSASAVRILFNIPAQVNWYPDDIRFILVALAVGAIVVVIAMKGFKRVAQFAEICAPWMIIMFITGALAVVPTLFSATPNINDKSFLDALLLVADSQIWVESNNSLGILHVAAFAWVCNFAMHAGMSDMTILRFAKKSQYGYFSALGMFIGHFLAWICAGAMGAGAALLLNSNILQLDAGGVAYQALGAAGIIAVIIAGWTTSNPTIYRAGLAFQSLNPRWNLAKVTAITGIITTIIACFPFVFTKLINFVSLMGLILAPIGAIIVCEHWLFPKLGLTRYWSKFKNQSINYAALLAWLCTLVFSYIAYCLDIHEFFLPPIAWVAAMVIYAFFAASLGAKASYNEKNQQENLFEEQQKNTELAYLNKEKYLQNSTAQSKRSIMQDPCFIVASICLLICIALAFATAMEKIHINQLHNIIIWPSLLYFISATYWAINSEKHNDNVIQ